MTNKLKNIRLSIWIEWWNWKPIKLLQNSQKKLKIKRIRTKLENIIFDKLKFNDEIEKKILQKYQDKKIINQNNKNWNWNTNNQEIQTIIFDQGRKKKGSSIIN
jgi:spore coat polysaccharide biosynthesis predicted glycosyltransferase SpsG